tara:strand:- start:19149 stop:20288 length:1140 start_codon:yes stop_codon:yes gene_type:complete
MTCPILPGSTIGIFGSGQLGRMIAISARQMGYNIHTFSPDTTSPTGQLADQEFVSAYNDIDAIRNFATNTDIITFEFENIPVNCLKAASEITPVHPHEGVLYTTQHRLREKLFLEKNGFPIAPFRHIKNWNQLNNAIDELGIPAVLKTAGFGYDGKGQKRIESRKDLASAWKSMGGQEAVLEKFINFKLELSVVAATSITGEFVNYGTIQNKHTNHILDISSAPADIPSAVEISAINLTRDVFTKLDFIGVACVEYFLDSEDNLVINEIAPRVHNSGHFSLDACNTSQFEQHVRAICGLPLGSTVQPRPAAMLNLLGNLWEKQEPDWINILTIPEIKLHLYGKKEPRAGRKMGHLTALGDTQNQAMHRILEAKEKLESI